MLKLVKAKAEDIHIVDKSVCKRQSIFGVLAIHGLSCVVCSFITENPECVSPFD
jgi:hypothetical protein